MEFLGWDGEFFEAFEVVADVSESDLLSLDMVFQTPLQELVDGVDVGATGVFVADLAEEEFLVAEGGAGAGGLDDAG